MLREVIAAGARPARPRRSSARPAPASRRWSTSSPGCTTRPAARCASTASTCATSTRRCSGARSGWCRRRRSCSRGPSRSNLRYGRADATDEELWEALELAQAADFVAAMPDGLEAPVAQGGTNVSGGQRQRLAIARALVKRPPVYLFDDAFSALDVATDARLRRALRPVVADATVLMVAQRVSTILERRPDPRARGRRGRRPRHARVAARELRDLPGDRPLAADAEEVAHDAPRPADGPTEGDRARRPGPRAPAAARSAAAWSARSRWTSALRRSGCCAGWDRTAWKAFGVRRCWPSSAWRCRSSGRGILGEATDLVFAG